MPTLVGKLYNTYFKRFLQINQTGNTGVDSTLRSIQSGDAETTAISLSDDVLQVKPVNDDTTATLDIKTSGGTSILTADTTNSVVKCGTSQVNPLTFFQEFGIFDSSMQQGYHTPLFSFPSGISDGQQFDSTEEFGNDAEPATSFDVSADTAKSEEITATYFYVPANIEIDEVRYISNNTNGSAITTNFYIFKYTLDVSTGDLSSGTKLASVLGVEPINAKILTGTLTLESDATASAGNILLAFAEEVDANASDTTCKLTVKYHIV